MADSNDPKNSSASAVNDDDEPDDWWVIRPEYSLRLGFDKRMQGQADLQHGVCRCVFGAVVAGNGGC